MIKKERKKEDLNLLNSLINKNGRLAERKRDKIANVRKEDWKRRRNKCLCVSVRGDETRMKNEKAKEEGVTGRR